ncbi:MAG: FKBP-type peptidyl-prolyl cis-trans isomerase [Cytophagaceae bacterium]
MLLRNLFIAGAFSALVMSCNSGSSSLKTEVDSLSYSIGLSIGNSFQEQSMDEVNVDLVAAAIRDVMNKKDLPFNEEEAGQIIQNYMMAKHKKLMEGSVKEGEEFLAKNKERPEVVELPSGLQYEIIKEGNGSKPGFNDKVTTHYHGTLLDGTVFDSSVERGEPITFPVNGVIRGWTEALQLMPKGSKWKLYVPANLAYGERGMGKIKPNSTLIFEVELIDIEAGSADEEDEE